jgi:putative ABC transport system permease protein
MRFDLRPGVRRLFRLSPRNRGAIHADIDEELESLIASRVDDLVARGMSYENARHEAVSRLGASLEDARRQLHQSAEHRERRMQFREYAEDLLQDVRYAARGLVKRPAFTAVAVLTLAIGIGATTAIFSAVNVMLLRPLPFAKPDELMKLTLSTPGRGDIQPNPQMVWSYPKYTSMREAQQVFSDVSAFASRASVITSDDVERISSESVGATYLRTLGLPVLAGRDFDRSIDAAIGAPKEVIISSSLWERRYNADRGAIGKTIGIDREPFTIIGVAPRGFKGLSGGAEVFIPITTSPAEELAGAQSHFLTAIARRKPGVSLQAAEAAMATIGRRIAQQYPDIAMGAAQWGAHAWALDESRVSPLVKRSLLILLGAVVFVLLIACVNVANLQLGRASSRRRELAVRTAIGAGRGRLVRLLLTESMLLATVGGALGLAVAWVGTHALSTVSTDVIGQSRNTLGALNFSSIRLDWSALTFALIVSAVTGVLFGLAPALRATRVSLSHALKETDADARGRVTRAFTGRRLLVVAEVALALVLLAGSGLMLRSLGKLLSVDAGFDPHDVLSVRLTVPQGGVPRDSLPGFYSQVLDRLASIPGVTNTAAGNCPPLNGGCNISVLWSHAGEPDIGHDALAGIFWATPDYFATMHIPITRGRAFTAADRADAAKALIVSETAARRLWPNENPLGKHIKVGQGGFEAGDGAEVIGVAGDTRQYADSLPWNDVYLPVAQSPRSGLILFVRSTRDIASLGTDVRKALKEIAPSFPVYDMQTMTARIGSQTAQARFSATLLGLFALTALSLAIVGIYGVMSLVVAARTREIGIRIALGADQSRVQRLVVREGVALVAIGAVAGLAGALVCTRALGALLFDVTPTDPLTYASIVVLLAGTAVVASWIPARRAARVDPVEALRAD